VNHTGLDREGVRNCLADTPLGRPTDDELELMFESLDGDDNGVIGLQELLSLITDSAGEGSTDTADGSVLFAETTGRCCPTFTEPHLEVHFRRYYAKANALLLSEGVAIVAVFGFLSVVCSVDASTGEVWTCVGLLSAFAAAFFAAITRSSQLRHFVEHHFFPGGIIVGLVTGGLSMWLGNCDPAAQASGVRGRGHLAAFKLAVFLFGFSKLTLKQAWCCLLFLLAATQVYLVVTGRYFGNGFSMVFAFCTGNLPDGSNWLSFWLVFFACVYCLVNSSAAADARSRRSFLIALNLVNEAKVASELAKGATAKLLLSTAIRQPLPAVNEQEDEDEEDQLCADLAMSLHELSNTGIHRLLAEFKSQEQERVFRDTTIEACKWSLWRKHTCISLLTFASFLNYYGTGSRGAGSQLLLGTSMLPVIIAVPANASPRVIQWCAAACHVLLTLITVEIWTLRLLAHDYFYAGVNPKIILCLYLGVIIVVYSLQVLTLSQKLAINFGVAALFCVQAMLILPNVFYPSADFVCPKCVEAWMTPDKRWGLEMGRLSTIILLIVFLACGGLNAHRAAMSQRRGFSGVQIKKAQSELNKARARSLSRKASLVSTLPSSTNNKGRAAADRNLLTKAAEDGGRYTYQVGDLSHSAVTAIGQTVTGDADYQVGDISSAAIVKAGTLATAAANTAGSGIKAPSKLQLKGSKFVF
jgi:hypothetical protein